MDSAHEAERRRLHAGEPEYLEGKPLYRLHDLASRPDDPVIVVEGEWCSDALARAGALATTSGAADSAAKADWRPLTERCVTIWPDNDEAGRRYATEAAERLRALGCAVRMIDVAALGLPPKGDAVEWLAANPGATAADIASLPTADATNASAGETNEQAVARLASMKPMDYDRVREAEAKRLEVRVGTLDSEVRKARGEDTGQGHAFTIESPEPWPEPVNGAELLDEIAATYRRYVVLPEHADTALALWTVHTYSYDYGRCTPILALTSPQKRCGKTTLMSVLLSMVNKPLGASNISPSCVFRSIDRWQPTLLIDEADSFIKDNEELRGIINSGHTRELAYVIRAVGDDHEPRRFWTWCPKAIALIGKLPPTLHDRAIEIQLVRKTAAEVVHRLNGFDGVDIRRKCARWVSDHASELREADPPVPSELHDRAADNWRPLLAIADLAGGEWPQRARTAAKALSEGDDSTESYAVMLLVDIRGLFEDRQVDRLFSEDIVEHLHTLEDRPWPQWGRSQKPITKNQVARLLKQFKIKPGTKRQGDETFKGYKREQFTDAFFRYLPAIQSVTPSQRKPDAGFQGFQSVTLKNDVTDQDPETRAPYGL